METCKRIRIPQICICNKCSGPMSRGMGVIGSVYYSCKCGNVLFIDSADVVGHILDQNLLPKIIEKKSRFA